MTVPPDSRDPPAGGDAEIPDHIQNQVDLLRGFAKAYPVSVFTPVTKEDRERMGDNLITRCSAEMGRHFASFASSAADRIESQAATIRAQGAAISELRRAMPLYDQWVAVGLEPAIIALQEENSRLRRELYPPDSALPAERETDAQAATIAQLREENDCTARNALALRERDQATIATLRQDAERYRWLRVNNHHPALFGVADLVKRAEYLDAAIDAEIGALANEEPKACS